MMAQPNIQVGPVSSGQVKSVIKDQHQSKLRAAYSRLTSADISFATSGGIRCARSALRVTEDQA